MQNYMCELKLDTTNHGVQNQHPNHYHPQENLLCNYEEIRLCNVTNCVKSSILF